MIWSLRIDILLSWYLFDYSRIYFLNRERSLTLSSAQIQPYNYITVFRGRVTVISLQHTVHYITTHRDDSMFKKNVCQFSNYKLQPPFFSCIFRMNGNDWLKHLPVIVHGASLVAALTTSVKPCASKTMSLAHQLSFLESFLVSNNCFIPGTLHKPCCFGDALTCSHHNPALVKCSHPWEMDSNPRPWSCETEMLPNSPPCHHQYD